jgi:hypothetical protein
MGLCGVLREIAGFPVTRGMTMWTKTFPELDFFLLNGEEAGSDSEWEFSISDSGPDDDSCDDGPDDSESDNESSSSGGAQKRLRSGKSYGARLDERYAEKRKQNFEGAF